MGWDSADLSQRVERILMGKDLTIEFELSTFDLGLFRRRSNGR